MSILLRRVFGVLAIATTAAMQPAMAQTPPDGGSSGGPPGGMSDRHGPDGRPHHPPPEAIAACNGKAAGASCSFVGRRGETLQGSCFAPPPRPDGGGPDGGSSGAAGGGQPPLACRPDRDKDRPPPQ